MALCVSVDRAVERGGCLIINVFREVSIVCAEEIRGDSGVLRVGEEGGGGEQNVRKTGEREKFRATGALRCTLTFFFSNFEFDRFVE